ncbi:tetratricopeptide repeat protein [Thermodesulfobacteriota bacterium]
MVDKGFKRKLAAILSADVEGYSRLMDDDEEATVRTITSCRSAITDLVQQYRGRVVDSPGDNILAEFASVVDSVNCAVEIQRELAERNAELPDNRKMQFRIGVNLGDVIEEDGRIYGDGVNIAARVESLAEAGGICISGRAHDQVENKLGLEYEDLGKHEVKNISRPIQVYRVLSYPGAAAHRVVQAKKTLGRRWRKIGFSAVAIVIVAVALGVWQFYTRRPAVEPASVDKMALPLPEKPSIAVLPFDNMSGDPEQDYIADGFTENIITGLSQIPAMFVIARNSVFTYKGKPVKVKQVSEELGVKYVLEGSIQKVGDRLRVNAQLIDAFKGHHLWAERYDRDLKDLFNLQDELTLKIAGSLEQKLTRGETRGNRYKTDSFEAWSHVVKGFSLLDRGTMGDILKARKHFEKAVNLDPDYAYAWNLLAWTYANASRWSESPGESIKRSIDLAQKAAALGENQEGIHSLMNRIYRLQGKYDEAIAEGKKSVALAPNSARAHIFLAASLHYGGRPEEAIVHAKKAMRLEPYYPAWFLSNLAGPYEMVGRYEEANAIWKQFLERALKGEFPPIYVHERLVIGYVRLGRMEEAHAHATEILKIKPDYTVGFYRKARSYKDKAYLENSVALLRKAGLPEKPPLPLPDKPSIAVLAFDNLSGDSEQEYFSDGISEEIITALSKIQHLFVIARTSSFKYKGKDVDLRTVGRELGVRYVLEGSVRIAEDKVRITAQLIDAQTNNHIWAERFDRVMKDIFSLQDEITIKIINALQVELTEGEHARLWRKGTDSLEAYLKSLQARELYLTQTKENIIQARRIAEEAIVLDPEYAPPYHVLSVIHFQEVFLGITKSPQQSFKQALEFIQKAIALDDSYALAYGWSGFLNTYIMKKYEKGIMEAQKGVDLDPNGAHGYLYLSLCLRYAGKFEEAIQAIEKAIRLNPFPPVTYFKFASPAYYGAGRYKEAIAAGEKAVKVSPNDAGSHMTLAIAFSLAGRQEEARIAAKEVLRLNPKFSVALFRKMLQYKNQDETERVIGAMLNAGLPE